MSIIRARGLEPELGKSVRVLFTATKDEYFPTFNALVQLILEEVRALRSAAR
jgi:hypothetical protein